MCLDAEVGLAGASADPAEAPLIDPGMLTSVKSSLTSAFVSKSRSASAALPASTTRYPAWVNMSEAPMRSSASSSTTITRACEGDLSMGSNGQLSRSFPIHTMESCDSRRLASFHAKEGWSPQHPSDIPPRVVNSEQTRRPWFV